MHLVRARFFRGFTLLELMVVIAIIAVLAGIALPVFSSVQERAGVTQDLNNLRQIGIATQTYLNDHDEILFADQAANPWMAALHPKYLPVWKAFQSPFDNRTAQESDTNAPVSYGLNENVPGTLSEKIERPTTFILFAPARASGSGVSFSGTPGTAVTVLRDVSSPGGTASGGTHGKRARINALFADLHCDGMTWATFKEPAAGPPDDDSRYRWDVPP